MAYLQWAQAGKSRDAQAWGTHPQCRGVKEVKIKKNISQKIIKQIEIHILHVVALTHKEILIHENT